ncbi:MAG: sigma-70 family RNA polymerase sigma factor [Planctomycetes bacterium]|nr:sigma-70 family RNA polymerase sigma factor [Planctomycetota bacterium]
MLARLRGGDDTATGDLFQAFEPFLRGLVRRRIPAAVRTRFDSADIVQSAWATLLDGFRGARWQFNDATHLRAFLTRVVLYRLYDRARGALTQTDREEPLAELGAELPGSEPRPSEHARAGAAWQTLLAACPPEHRQVLELRRLGYTCEEIGTRTGFHAGSVRRILRNLARRIAFDDTIALNPSSSDAQ